MSLLSCNCQGLGQSRAISILRELFRAHKIHVLFLTKTLVLANKIEEIKLDSVLIIILSWIKRVEVVDFLFFCVILFLVLLKISFKIIMI